MPGAAVLTLAYSLHMAATVVWIGGLFYQAVVLAPALRGALGPEARRALLESLRRRFEPLAWLSLVVLIVSGLIQMTGSPHYRGLLVIGERWGAAMAAKHAAIALMVALAAYQTWFLYPRLARQALLESRGRAAEAGPALGQHSRLTRFNLALGLLVLILTAVARTA